MFNVSEFIATQLLNNS